MDKLFEIKYLGKFLINDRIDCNNCYHISVTEEQQQRLGNRNLHYCRCYNQRLFHKTQSAVHNNYIYPCRDCTDNNYKMYHKER
jgi:hypothetical protein